MEGISETGRGQEPLALHDELKDKTPLIRWYLTTLFDKPEKCI